MVIQRSIKGDRLHADMRILDALIAYEAALTKAMGLKEDPETFFCL